MKRSYLFIIGLVLVGLVACICPAVAMQSSNANGTQVVPQVEVIPSGIPVIILEVQDIPKILPDLLDDENTPSDEVTTDDEMGPVMTINVVRNPENQDGEMELNISGNTDVKAGEIVKITVLGQPSTGYTWQTSESEGLKIVKSDIIRDSNPRHRYGGIDTYVWYVTAEKPGKYTFSMEYGRPWDWENTIDGKASFDIIFS